MCSCDVDTGSADDFWSETWPKARKPHPCSECDGGIARGERYQRVSGKWDGRMYSYATCALCHAYSDALRQAEQAADPDCAFAYEKGALWECIAEFCSEVLGYDPHAYADDAEAA